MDAKRQTETCTVVPQTALYACGDELVPRTKMRCDFTNAF